MEKKGFNFMESMKKPGIRMVIVLIVFLTNIMFNGYNFFNVGSDMDFLIDAEVERIETNIIKQIYKIKNDETDIKKPDFETAFEALPRLAKRGDEYAPIVSRLAPLVKRMQEYYLKNLN